MCHAGPAHRYHGAHSSAVKRSNPVRYRSCTLGVCACVCDIHHFGWMAAHHVHTLNVLQRIMAHGPLIATAGCQSHCGCLSERTVAAAVRLAASKNAVGAHPQLLLFVMRGVLLTLRNAQSSTLLQHALKKRDTCPHCAATSVAWC